MSDWAFVLTLTGWSFAVGAVAWVSFAALGRWLHGRHNYRRQADWFGGKRWLP